MSWIGDEVADVFLHVFVKKPGCVLAGLVVRIRDRGREQRGYELAPTSRACWVAGLILWGLLIGAVALWILPIS